MANSVGKPKNFGKMKPGGAKANPMFTGKASKAGKMAAQYKTGVAKNSGGKNDTGDKVFKKGKKGSRDQS